MSVPIKRTKSLDLSPAFINASGTPVGVRVGEGKSARIQVVLPLAHINSPAALDDNACFILAGKCFEAVASLDERLQPLDPRKIQQPAVRLDGETTYPRVLRGDDPTVRTYVVTESKTEEAPKAPAKAPEEPDKEQDKEQDKVAPSESAVASQVEPPLSELPEVPVEGQEEPDKAPADAPKTPTLKRSKRTRRRS